MNQTVLFPNLKEELVDNVVMIRLTGRVQMFIRNRVYKSEFLPGSTGDSNYSTTPMPVPYGLFVKKFGKGLLKKEGAPRAKNSKRIMSGKKFYTSAYRDEFSVFRSKSGKVMVLIQGGYKRWRELNKKSSGLVQMTWSTRMMRNLGILRTDKTEGEIGFSSAEESRKAYYQHVGAGKNRITHKFMDVTKGELDELAELAEKLIFQKLQ